MSRHMTVLLLIWWLRNASASQCQVAQMCVTDLTENDCASIETFVPNYSVFGCCPSCVWMPEPPVPPPPEVVDTEECRPPASCLPDGRFAPVQCKGDLFMGRCFCYDENGNRIFGQMWRSEANEMTCACSRRRAEIEASGRRTVTLHCTRTGDYEPLQCDNGMCWCAQPKTGQPIVGPVPEEDMKLLPCYSASVTGESYFRRCESIVHALAIIHQEQSEHGTSFLGNPITFCDYDGSYGSYQIQNGVVYCTGRDGAILGSWSAMANQISTMNCNCARDTAVYFPERGMTVTEVCQANGNYQREQIVGDYEYCVDSDGYQVDC